MTCRKEFGWKSRQAEPDAFALLALVGNSIGSPQSAMHIRFGKELSVLICDGFVMQELLKNMVK